ncbi:DUF501 domain-containing protein [Limnochorda pilosa]|uniref:Ppx/GppA phosphatase N-terminal domain-containing protein n=1 Tax=Limnochorda pilosa TaxID=1555112 RepID=A0A0K2SQJ2_LIMPI|nr:DUF501 domain-containing protein [Limnochorda pilosa]BAS29395.1 hypothetical protein LIP_3586 [Limnochorda pilosa]
MTRAGLWGLEPAGEADERFVAAVLGRSPSPIAGVATRCRFGRPQVVANHPLPPSGDPPMPTLFWLVCPLLVYEVARLESQGWIRALGREVASNPDAAAAEARADRLDSLIRRRLLGPRERHRLQADNPRLWTRLGRSGVGGREGPGVKCLHAHLAHHLALGDGYVGRRVAELLRRSAVPLDGSLVCGCADGRGRPLHARQAPRAERSAVVELGSHSVRALVADRIPEGLRVVEQHLWVTRLGEGLQEGRLGGPALERSLEAAQRLADRARRVGAARVLVVGTSAVREATNGQELAGRVRQATGAALQVLSGEDEARHTFRGAMVGLGAAGPGVVMDLGGGSVELARGSLDRGPQELLSLPWGALRLSRRFDTGTTPARVRELTQWLEGQLPRAMAPWQGAAVRLPLVVVGGTATSLAAMEQGLRRYRPDRVHGYGLAVKDLGAWVDRLAALSLEGVRRLPGLQPERAPVILAGATVLWRLAEWLGAVQVLVSEWDLMAGLLDAAGRDDGWAR